MKAILSVLTALLFFVGMSVAQTAGTQSSQSGTAGDQAGTAQSQTQATPADQTTTDQSSTQTTTTTTRRHKKASAAAADQNADQNGAAANSDNNGKLPQTASPLPLLGLLGMGSLGLGAISRRKRK